jgi:hypothetical protein
MAGRGSTLKSHEVSRAVRVRGPKKLLEKLSRLNPSELGAWAYHAEVHLSKNAPELSLEHPPKPINEEEKTVNEKLAKVLEAAKPVRFKKVWCGLGLSKADTAEDERYWQEREKEKRTALKREQKREFDS